MFSLSGFLVDVLHLEPALKIGDLIPHMYHENMLVCRHPASFEGAQSRKFAMLWQVK